MTKNPSPYVVHEPVRGFGAACHTGLRAATADIVCFCAALLARFVS